MIEITMMQLRAEPGEYFHLVYKHGETVIITKARRRIAQICPIENTMIDNKGKIHGELPLTFKKPELLRN